MGAGWLDRGFLYFGMEIHRYTIDPISPHNLILCLAPAHRFVAQDRAGLQSCPYKIGLLLKGKLVAPVFLSPVSRRVVRIPDCPKEIHSAVAPLRWLRPVSPLKPIRGECNQALQPRAHRPEIQVRGFVSLSSGLGHAEVVIHL